MAEPPEQLLAEFAAAWSRGENPDPRSFLERADDSEALARLIDRYLVSAPAREPAPELVEAIDAWLQGEPTLSTIRARRGRRVDDVVAAIIRGCGLGRERASKVKEYYQRLESGLLDPAAVQPPVFAAIGEVLGMPVAELPIWPGAPAEGAPVLRPRPDAAAEGAPAPLVAELMSLAADPPDEVDRLFGVSP